MITARRPSPKEEYANCLSHGFGMIGAALLTPVIVAAAAQHGDAISVAGAWAFGFSMVLLYASSAIFHGVPWHLKKVKRFFNTLDHIAVYILIAGTYTPYMLDTLRGPFGWSLFGFVWILALAGAVLKFRGQLKRTSYSVAYYLAMGWIAILAVVPLTARLSTYSLATLVAGGLLYSFGVYYYLSHHRPYAHLVWHIFVLAGTACHVLSVLGIYASNI